MWWLARSSDGDWLSAPYDHAAHDGSAASDPVKGLNDQFLTDRDDSRRKFFAHDLVKLAETHELPEFAAQVRALFDLPDLADPPEGSTHDGEDGWPDPPDDGSPPPPGSG